jgi:hypothetical protein
MMKSLVAASIVYMAIFAPVPIVAKASTVKTTITIPERFAAIEITDPAVGEFCVWAGAGVLINGVPQTDGFIVDWTKGPMAKPPETCGSTGSRSTPVAGGLKRRRAIWLSHNFPTWYSTCTTW